MRQTSGSVLRKLLDQVNQDRKLAVNMTLSTGCGPGLHTETQASTVQGAHFHSSLLPDCRRDVTPPSPSCGQCLTAVMNCVPLSCEPKHSLLSLSCFHHSHEKSNSYTDCLLHHCLCTRSSHPNCGLEHSSFGVASLCA